MSGPACQFPNDCQARGYGVHCRRCSASDHMRRLNADPVFRAATAKRGAAQLRMLLGSKAHTESCAKGALNCHASLMRRLGVPVGMEDVYRFAREKKFTRQEAVEIARRESERRERI